MAAPSGFIISRMAGAQGARLYRVGLIARRELEATLGILREGLRQLGYVEDPNIAFEGRFAQDNLTGCPRSPPRSFDKGLISLSR